MLAAVEAGDNDFDGGVEKAGDVAARRRRRRISAPRLRRWHRIGSNECLIVVETGFATAK